MRLTPAADQLSAGSDFLSTLTFILSESMSDIPISISAITAGGQVVVSGAAAGSAAALPAGIRNLPIGHKIKGQIIGLDRAGQFILQTRDGVIKLNASLPLEENQQLVLRVESAGSHFRASIVSVDHKPLADYLKQTGATLPGGESGTAASHGRNVSGTALQPGASLPTGLQEGGQAKPLPPALGGTPDFIVSLNQKPVATGPGYQPFSTSVAAVEGGSQSEEAGFVARANLQAQSSMALPPDSRTVTAGQRFPGVFSFVAHQGLQQLRSLPQAPEVFARLAAGQTVQLQILQVGGLLPVSPTQGGVVFPAPAGAENPVGQTPLSSAVSSTSAAAPQSPATGQASSALPASSDVGSGAAAAEGKTPTPLPPSSSAASFSGALAVAQGKGQNPSGSQVPASALLPHSVTVDGVVRQMPGLAEKALHTSIGVIRLPPDLSLPDGLVVRMAVALTLEQESEKAAFYPALPAAEFASPVGRMAAGQGWQAMDQLLQTMRLLHPPLAAALSNAMIQPGPDMGAAILHFMKEVRQGGGDIGRWLGPEIMRFLEKIRRPDLAQRLGEDFQRIRQAFADSAGMPWQVLFIPVHDGRTVQMARLYLHREEAEGDGRESGPTKRKGTRFVVEVDLSVWGALQLDGLVYPPEEKRKTQFDLFVRTHRPLEEDHRQAMQALYLEAAEQTGFEGQIMFRVEESFPVDPGGELAQYAPHNTILA